MLKQVVKPALNPQTIGFMRSQTHDDTLTVNRLDELATKQVGVVTGNFDGIDL